MTVETRTWQVARVGSQLSRVSLRYHGSHAGFDEAGNLANNASNPKGQPAVASLRSQSGRAMIIFIFLQLQDFKPTRV